MTLPESFTTGLQALRDDPDWSRVRDADLFEAVEIRCPLGMRRAIRLRAEFKERYELLQLSRGVDIRVDDDWETLVARVESQLDVMMPDLVRASDLTQLQIDLSVRRVAEIGFRVPKLARHFLALGAASFVGLDVSHLSVDVGNTLGFDCHHLDLGASTVPIPQLADVDLILCYHVLEHVTNPMVAAHRLATSTRPGTLLHVEVPIEPDGPRPRFGHLFPFHRNDLGSMLMVTGWNVIAVSEDRPVTREEFDRDMRELGAESAIEKLRQRPVVNAAERLLAIRV